MLLQPQKECSSRESQTPAPTSGLSLPCRPNSILCERGAQRVTKGWGDLRRFFQRLSGLALGLHLPICKVGGRGSRARVPKRQTQGEKARRRQEEETTKGQRKHKAQEQAAAGRTSAGTGAEQHRDPSEPESGEGGDSRGRRLPLKRLGSGARDLFLGNGGRRGSAGDTGGWRPWSRIQGSGEPGE